MTVCYMFRNSPELSRDSDSEKLWDTPAISKVCTEVFESTAYHTKARLRAISSKESGSTHFLVLNPFGQLFTAPNNCPALGLSSLNTIFVYVAHQSMSWDTTSYVAIRVLGDAAVTGPIRQSLGSTEIPTISEPPR